MIVRLAIAWLVSAAVFGAIEARWPSRTQPRWRRGMWTDLAYWLFTPTVSHALGAIAVLVVGAVVLQAAGVPLDRAHVVAFVHRPTWFGALPRGAQVVFALVAGDLVGYWMHRWFHGRALWKIHAVHHSSIDLDWLSATRLHPLNEVIQRGLQAGLLLALGIDTTVVLAYAPVLTIHAIALHANVSWDFGPLRYVIASPRFHRWHHTSQAEGRDKNFAGFFPVWDLVFGTCYLPRGVQPTTFGADSDGAPVPEGLVAQLAYPFRARR